MSAQKNPFPPFPQRVLQTVSASPRLLEQPRMRVDLARSLSFFSCINETLIDNNPNRAGTRDELREGSFSPPSRERRSLSPVLSLCALFFLQLPFPHLLDSQRVEIGRITRTSERPSKTKSTFKPSGVNLSPVLANKEVFHAQDAIADKRD